LQGVSFGFDPYSGGSGQLFASLFRRLQELAALESREFAERAGNFSEDGKEITAG
jgi:hypothetical protein